MKLISTIALAFLLLPTPSRAAGEREAAADLLGWLEQHGKDFAACEPRAEADHYELCDATRVPRAEIKRLFALTAEKLLEELRAKGLRVELVCAPAGEKARLGGACAPASKNKMFTELTSLHGKYLPEEKTILIRSSASVGSLVHEWVHSLQSLNERPVYGRVYKRERNEVQRGLTHLMDEKIAEVAALEKQGRQGATAAPVQTFMLASEATRAFAPWQDLIDEREIFLLYRRFGKEFGASADDLALARKNMGFICGNEKLKKILPPAQCEL